MSLYNHAEVPNNFEVPRDPSWPEETWDVKLGRSLVNIVSKVLKTGMIIRRMRTSY